jgi:type VI secretion system protein
VAGRGLLSRLNAGAAKELDENDSITAHLRVLLNTRKGEAITAPGFGIVDFTDLVHGFPVSIQTLLQSIRATVLEYEPRLKNVTVRHAPSDNPLLLRFEITAQLAGKGTKGTLRFQTQMSAGGQVDVW